MGSKEDWLNAIREKQGHNGPNYCLGAAKFFIGKLVGIFDEKKHLNDFINSQWSRTAGKHIDLKAAWGLFQGAKDFNAKVLPAAISDASANVKASGPPVGTSVEFHSFKGGAVTADALLLGKVPLVIGVDLLGGYARDHFISILRDQQNNVWVVDSWGVKDSYAVAQLAADFSFTKPVKADLNAGMTTIPCPTPWIGYYRDTKTKSALAIKANV